MARKPRFTLPGVPQHIIQRGHNREPCFYALDDYWRYRSDLHEAANANQVAIHAYVLMTNHVHLLATPAQEYSITHMMQDLGRKYVRYINHTYRRSGSLWEGRFKASLVDSEAYLLTCMRYIEMNPVRANMVCHPSEYGWSSYAANAQGQSDKLISPHPLYLQLGTDQEQRLYAYRELFNQHLDKTEVHAIRSALNQELVLGREDFKDKIEVMLKRQVRPGLPGRPRVEDLSAIYYVF
ncbi:MAG: transposase [Gammaproteobacteria bacterium]|nr:transposase [Gammaproteobacteria bacterium]